MSEVAAKYEEAKLPAPVERRGITEAQWRTAQSSLYPGADSPSILMVFDYCKARGLDPLKKPCHIVPMQVKDAKTGRYSWRDVILPGIYEIRTTAMRTGEYMGHSKPEYGPSVEYCGVTAPEWCEMTIYRWNAAAQCKTEFPVRVMFSECCGTKKEKDTNVFVANARWMKAPVQMMTKCTEAAGLREAFPDELGGVQSAEEMEGQRIIEAEVEKPRSHSTPTDGAWDAIPEEVQSRLQDIAVVVSEYLEMGDNDSAAKSLSEAELDADEQVAFWTRFNSKQRSALKKAMSAPATVEGV